MKKYFTNSKPLFPPSFFWKIYHGNHWIVTVEYVQFNLDCCFSSFNSDRKTLSSWQKYRAVEALSFSWLRSVSKLGDYNLASPWLNLLLVRKLWKLFLTLHPLLRNISELLNSFGPWALKLEWNSFNFNTLDKIWCKFVSYYEEWNSCVSKI